MLPRNNLVHVYPPQTVTTIDTKSEKKRQKVRGKKFAEYWLDFRKKGLEKIEK